MNEQSSKVKLLNCSARAIVQSETARLQYRKEKAMVWINLDIIGSKFFRYGFIYM
jgi:hypothetical protein